MDVYSIKEHAGKNSRKASYVNTVNSFESFQEFAEWCQDQYGYLNKDEKGRYWQLDKDLLYFGNNAYSPTTCVFIPLRLNSFIPASLEERIGQFLQGVVGIFITKSSGQLVQKILKS